MTYETLAEARAALLEAITLPDDGDVRAVEAELDTYTETVQRIELQSVVLAVGALLDALPPEEDQEIEAAARVVSGQRLAFARVLAALAPAFAEASS